MNKEDFQFLLNEIEMFGIEATLNPSNLEKYGINNDELVRLLNQYIKLEKEIYQLILKLKNKD